MDEVFQVLPGRLSCGGLPYGIIVAASDSSGSLDRWADLLPVGWGLDTKGPLSVASTVIILTVEYLECCIV